MSLGYYEKCFLYGYDNQYNAKTETQFKFAQRIEEELGLICDFNHYCITRGRGWSHRDGSASSSVCIKDKEGTLLGGQLVLYYPLRNYLSKKKYISSYKWGLDIHIELEDRKELGGEVRHLVDIKWSLNQE